MNTTALFIWTTVAMLLKEVRQSGTPAAVTKKEQEVLGSVAIMGAYLIFVLFKPFDWDQHRSACPSREFYPFGYHDVE